MKKRQLVYVPKIEPNTFLFFNYRGDTGRSYSFRDYTVTPDPPRLTYAESYPYSADEILAMATWHFDADRISTKEVGYWREQIESRNRQFLAKAVNSAARPQSVIAAREEDSSSTISIWGKHGNEICSVDDWLRYAPPKRREYHWKDGRSAKELAKAICARGIPSVPTELLNLLASCDQLGDVQLTEGWPEHNIPLDSSGRGPRNADLAAVGTGKAGMIAVTIEAKADERFDYTIAKAPIHVPINSKLPNRIESLSKSILGVAPCEVGELRYQLLQAIAATLIFAKKNNAVAAVFVVFEFNGPLCSQQNLKRNTADLDAFVSALSPAASPLKAGQIVGPIFVPGDDLVPGNMPLFIGKAVRFIQ